MRGLLSFDALETNLHSERYSSFASKAYDAVLAPKFELAVDFNNRCKPTLSISAFVRLLVDTIN
jgi:hypothetical protein